MTIDRFYKEQQNGFTTFSEYAYEDPKSAYDIARTLPSYAQTQMAEVYKEAFGGPPWYERVRCNSCETFYKDAPAGCTKCGSMDIGEAYPTKELLETYFPEMLSEFTPGILTLAEREGRVVGFTTGGFIGLEDLVRTKYKANPLILESITQVLQQPPNTSLFYDNETCVLPGLQKEGIGKLLSLARVNAAKSRLGTQYICGRTINIPWLELKRKQLTKQGYSFVSFVPKGDTYEVDGNKRNFYLARLI